MHKMEKTPKILSIIGSCFDFIGLLGVISGAVVFKVVMTEDFLINTLGVPATEIDEIQEILSIYQFMGNIMIFFAMLLLLIFIVNLIVNIRLMSGKLSEHQAKVHYTYQLFIGVVLMLLNTISGIVYIISGVQGRNGEPDKIKTREGL